MGQQDNWIPFREIIDEGRLVIFDLGNLDEESQRFIGALLAHGFEEAAISRSDIPERERKPHHLFMDEFAAFSSSTEAGLARILSQARKYKLTLWLAHQTWGQLSERVENALQNTTRAAFALGMRDSQLLAPTFTQYEPLAYKYIQDEDGGPIKQFYSPSDTFAKMATELQNLKPRQTRSDKWKQRPMVLRYRVFADELRFRANNRKFSLPDQFSVTFYLPMPPSWSQKKRQELEETPHQQKPDADNLAKALMDALKANDATVWDIRVRKLWAKEGKITICTEEDMQ